MHKRAWVAVLALVAVLAVAADSVGAQGGDDAWTDAYRPALLAQFAGDMALLPGAPRYDVALILSVDEQAATLIGHQSVRYTNRTPATTLDELVFRLYPNLVSYGAEMQVGRVTVGGISVVPALDTTHSVLTVPLPAPLAPGLDMTLEMDFSVRVEAGGHALYDQFSYLEGVLALPQAYPVLSVFEPGSGWWQVTDHPQGDATFSETAFFTVRITAPANLILAASGSLVDLVVNADGTLTHHYAAPLMRDFALFASTDFVTLSGEQDGVRINLYYNPELSNSQQAARVGLQMTQDALRIYNTAYGQYPFIELDVVQTLTTAGGMEYPGVFVIGRSAWDPDDVYFEFLIAHETAHQWWYALVGNDQTLYPWLDEGLAQFSVAVYIRELEGEPSYQNALSSFRVQYQGFAAEAFDQTIGSPVTAYPDQAYFYIVYQKSPLFFATLAEEYGYDTMLQVLQDYFFAYRYRYVTPPDLLSSFESSLGVDLDTLFAEWVGMVAVG